MSLWRYTFGTAALAWLIAAVWYGYRILRSFTGLAARERLARQRAETLDAHLQVARAEQDSERRLWGAALDREGRP